MAPLKHEKSRIGTVAPLDHELYSRVYNEALFPNSTEYRRTDGSEGPMLSFVKDILRRLRPSGIVSIGAGAGTYDAELLHVADISVDRYVVIEPNPHHTACLAANMPKTRIRSLEVIEDAFDSSFPLERVGEASVDFVMFAHSLYFVAHPGKVVGHALSLLRTGGILLVQQQAHDTPISKGYRKFNEEFGIEWESGVSRQDHLVTNRTIGDELEALGIPSRLHEEPAHFLVDSFYEGDSEIRTLLLGFMMNTDPTQLPPHVVEAWTDWVKAHSSYNTQTGRHELPHFQGFVVVEKK